METTTLGKYSVNYPNSTEYHSLKREIWTQNTYFFETDLDSPFIVDIGAHIGISVLYFKSIYPASRILAFEPNPLSFKILSENIYNNGLEDIVLVQEAISNTKGTKDFHIDNSQSNWHSNSSFLKGGWTGKEDTKCIKVKTTTLEEYANEDIDMLKIDIEGNKLQILKSIKILPRVKNIAVEYHPVKGSKVKNILDILNRYFDIQILEEGKEIKRSVEKKLLTIKGKKRM
jgi:FkbM family methyltransferase